MLKYLVIIVSFCCLFSFSQEKEQSLLWEITGNGLNKASYIYGTMHVSKKVAFRLDDIFFDALEKSETIALESDPSNWLEHNYQNTIISPQNFSYAYRKGFYTALFNFEAPEELLIRNAIKSDNRMINGYLYRKNLNTDNFEEETYLDMFIYQAGKKKNKPIISLEDLDEAEYLTSKARSNAYKKKPDPWLAQIYEKESPYLLQENTYRERNLKLLDSIGEASNTSFFRENMLFIRNENMVKVLDSVMQYQSVFSGVGAAHLPGEKGMLNLLRKKGYKIKALTSNQSKKAHYAKQSIENYIATPQLKKVSTEDGFISLNSFTNLKTFFYNRNKFTVSPDMTNGAYLTISRFNIFNYFPQDKKDITINSIDNFLFEDIPGDIIEKEKIDKPFPGLSVLNKTKKGDYQKYHIYKTPLEVIIIKFGGPKNYVLNFEKEIFNSIRFKKPSKTIETFNSPYNKYEVNFPEFRITDNLINSGNKLIQGTTGTDFYFLKESVNQDINYIEEDAFEAKYSIENLFKELEIDDTMEGYFENDQYKSYVASARKEASSKTRIYLKSIVKDGSYFLLGYSGLNKNKAESFFNSFKLKEINYKDFETTVDTALHFKVKTNVKPIVTNSRAYSTKNKKPYESQTKTTVYFSKANERVFVSRTKFHDLQMFKNIDSLWHEVEHYREKTRGYNKTKPFIITNRKKDYKDSVYTYTFKYKDSLSSKAILVKNILKKGTLFQLKTLVDTIAKPSTFVTQFYNTFTPLDTLLGKPVLTDKTGIFFSALQANDSIVMSNRDLIKFNNSHVNKLISTIKNFDFPENKTFIKLDLIRDLIALDNPKTIPFLKSLYKESYSNPEVQTTILKGLLNKKTKQTYQDFLELLNIDLPLEKYAIKSLFLDYRDSLKLKKTLFPELLEYITVPEYKEPIYALLAKLKDSGLIKPKLYKKYKKIIINDGKTEIKRSLSETSGYASRKSKLYNYVKLIFPFRKEKTAQNFFNKLLNSDNARALTTYYVLLEKTNEPIPKSLKNKTLNNYKNQAQLITKLYYNNLKKQYSNKVISQQQFAKSYLFSDVEIEKERDSIAFLETIPFVTDNGKKGKMYFYILHRKNDYGDSKKLYYVAFLNPKNANDIQTKAYYESGYTGNFIREQEDELIKEALELAKHKTRKRINRK
ncbi:TraB/GumN family protein [Lacinutrix sp. MedPE-SW]|uniref:TraB/GumN family protein n=1 Tax=Lacinutrix sp. MedPE-SW TaxID=1860087 RepID=UPI00091C2F7A|nr:TraB/GumN family protein [Lacinutrix sp. MedPE-SW]OIQ23585.1 MAG: TraB/GumN family protein [Lacinutrix sp. MedPE-SW]